MALRFSIRHFLWKSLRGFSIFDLDNNLNFLHYRMINQKLRNDE